MENENMNNEIQAPEPNSVEFAQQPVPTMANQNMHIRNRKMGEKKTYMQSIYD